MPVKLFGTDGIRGQANTDPMTAEIATKVAMAVADIFVRGEDKHRVVIGKDTRLSGYMIEPALTAGFIAKGMDVILLGPMPTPAVAMMVRSLRADIGVMISASHNPYQDNGLKFFTSDGLKLSDEIEQQIENIIASPAPHSLAAPSKIGRAKRIDDAGRYIEYVKATFPTHLRLDGMKIVVDTANGAAYKIAPTILWELGADVIPINITPNGMNINDQCGATHPDVMQKAVLEHGADIGLALDGDADRLIIADEHGQKIDGDQILGLLAVNWQKAGSLKGKNIVATTMSNLGLEQFLSTQNIGLIRTAVGDRHVIAQMRESGCNIGGEQSGHIILNDYNSTGDAMIAALQVLSILRQGGDCASHACHVFKPMPQILRNIRAHPDILQSPQLRDIVKQSEELLKDQGRILIRKSGTENLIRVMAEGHDAQQIKTIVDRIIETIEKTGT